MTDNHANITQIAFQSIGELYVANLILQRNLDVEAARVSELEAQVRKLAEPPAELDPA